MPQNAFTPNSANPNVASMSEVSTKLAPAEFLNTHVLPSRTDLQDIQTATLTQEVDFSDLYDYGGAKIGYVSRYPTYMPNRNNEAFFGDQQGVFDKIGAMGTTFFTLAGNTFANHFTQYGRELDALMSGEFNKLWNSDQAKRTAERIQAVQNLNPIYMSERAQQRKERQRGLGGALAQYIPLTPGAGSAWANLGGQLGFTAGTLFAVGLENVALGVATGGFGNAMKAPTSASTVVRSFWQLAKAGKTFDSAYDLSRLAVGSREVGAIYRTLHASAGEASIEAGLSALEFERAQIEAFEDKYGFEPSEDEIAEIKNEAVKVGNVTFSWNIPVLMASNTVMFHNLFRPTKVANQVYREGAEELVLKQGAVKTMKESVKDLPKFQKAMFKGKQIAKGSKDVLSEGFEELAQGIGSSTAQHLYDLYQSPYASDSSGFLATLGRQTAEALGSSEGWDEFVAGALTGGGIKMGKIAYNKFTGGNKAKELNTAVAQSELTQAISNLGQATGIFSDATMEAIAREVSPAKTENENMTVQAMSAYGMQEAVNRNDQKSADDIRDMAKIQFYATMRRYDKLNEVVDMYAESLREMQEQMPEEFEKMMGDRTIEGVVKELKDGGAEYNRRRNNLDKKFRNKININKDYKGHFKFEKAKDVLAGLYMYGHQSFDRAEALAQDLKNRGVNNEVINAIADPESLPQSISTIESMINVQKENLKLAPTKGEKDAIRQEIKKNQSILKILKDVDNVASETDMRNVSASIVRDIRKKRADLVPDDLQKDIDELQVLEKEGSTFVQMYNLIAEGKDLTYFDRFMAGFNKTAKANEVPTATEQAQETTPTTPVGEEATLNEAEFNDDINEVEFDDEVGVRVVADEALNLLEEGDKQVTPTEDGKFEYNGEVYDTREQAHDAILDSYSDRGKLNATTPSGTLRSSIKKRFNALRREATAETVQEDPTEPLRQPRTTEASTESFMPPKTKTDVANEKPFGFSGAGGQTMLHFFDKVIAMVWRSPSRVLGRLESSKDAKHFTLVEDIKDAFREFGNEAQLTTIHLWSEANIEKLKDDQIKVFYDGIRFFIVTKGKTGASNIIRDKLGLHVEESGKFGIVKQGGREGADIVSDFELTSPKSESVEAIHTLKEGDRLNVRVADNDFNKQLLEDKPDGWEDQLVIEMYKENADGSETAVGMLRATDFLFQDTSKKAEIEAFRDRVKNSPIGELIGTVPFTAFSVSRNVAYERGVPKFTKLEAYEQGMDEIGWDVEYFYANSPNELLDQNGQNVTGLDRKSFREGAIYMRVKKRGSNQEHTVQVYDSANSTFTPQEFKDGTFKERAETNLRPRSNPLISKRIITNTRQLLRPGETAPESFPDTLQDTPTESSNVTSTSNTFDNASNKKLWIINNANRGDRYTLSDGTEIKVMETFGNEVVVRRSKGGFHTVEKYVFEEGKVKTQNQIKGTITSAQYSKPTRSVIFDIFAKVEAGEPLSSREYNIALRKADRLAKMRSEIGQFYRDANATPVEDIKRSLMYFGQDPEMIMNQLLRAYTKSVIDRNPISTWEQLMEASNLTQDQREALEQIVTPSLSPLVWAYVTQADAIWGFRRNEGFANMLEGMQEELRDLSAVTQGMNERNTPFKKAQQARDKIVSRLREQMGKIGADFIDEKVLNYLPEVDFKGAVNAVVDAFTGTVNQVVDKLKGLQDTLSQYEIGISLGGMMKVLNLDINSRGRNPQYSSDFDNVFTDIMMAQETELLGVSVVRNEKDGLFVEVQNDNRRVTRQVLIMQKRILDLLGVELPAEYLQAYLKVNGNFKGLKRRLFAEQIRSGSEIPNSFGIIEEFDPLSLKDEAVDRTGKLQSVHGAIRLVNATDYYIKIDGKVYRNVMILSPKKGAYVLDSRPLSQEQVRDAMLSANIRPEKPSNHMTQVDETIGSRASLDKKKDDISCGR